MNKRVLPQIKLSSLILWLIVGLMIFFVFLSVTLRREEEELETPPERAIPVETVHVEAQPARDIIQLPGRVEADIRSRLAVDKGGRVVEILADRGDVVEAGQVLLRIDDRAWKKLLNQAEIELADAERAYHRWHQLAASGMISTGEYDTVRTRLDRARVGVEDAELHVEQCRVISPAAGVINDRFVEVGEFAPEGSAVLEFVVTDPAKLTLHVPERDVASVKVGEAISFVVSVLPGKSFEGVITHVAEAGSAANNSFRVEARVDNPDRHLRPGMIATTRLVRERHDEAIVIPLSAVIPRLGEHFVFLARDDRAIRRLVKIDRILGADVMLADGLEVGDELVLEGHRMLIDGSLIERVQ